MDIPNFQTHERFRDCIECVVFYNRGKYTQSALTRLCGLDHNSLSGNIFAHFRRSMKEQLVIRKFTEDDEYLGGLTMAIVLARVELLRYLKGIYELFAEKYGNSKISRTWSSISRCCAVTHTLASKRPSSASVLTNGAIFIASGRVPNTVRIFFIIEGLLVNLIL